MFTLYSSVCRLLSPESKKISPVISCSSLYPGVIYTKTDTMDTVLSLDNSYGVINSKNDTGEIIILQYQKYDKTFSHYRPKFYNYK
jgi:hypothetical protein